MTKDNLTSRLYNISSTIKAAIKAQKMQGYETLFCSAALYRKGKRLNSIEKADTRNFSRLMLSYVRSEDPDKMKIELRGDQEELLWSKTFNLEPEDMALQGVQSESTGLGEAEVSEMVNKKLQDIRRNEELEDLRSTRDQLEQENEQLQKQLGELEDTLSAKKNIEYYSNIIGMALPGLAKMLNGSPFGGALGMLAGSSEDPETPKREEGNQRQAIVDLVAEFLQTLDDAQLGQIYLVFVELSNNPALIPELLSKISTQSSYHDIQEGN
jgi:hypothetical protein